MIGSSRFDVILDVEVRSIDQHELHRHRTGCPAVGGIHHAPHLGELHVLTHGSSGDAREILVEDRFYDVPP